MSFIKLNQAKRSGKDGGRGRERRAALEIGKRIVKLKETENRQQTKKKGMTSQNELDQTDKAEIQKDKYAFR